MKTKKQPIKYSIVTMLFNNYDLLREPEEVDENAEYICITDNPDLKSNVWKIMYMAAFNTDKLTGFQKTYITKYSKLLDVCSTESKYVIRVDASIQIHKKLTPIVEYIDDNNYDALLMIHNYRDDFINEYNVWITGRGLDKKYMERFIRYTSENGFNINHTGLIECTIQCYRICDKTATFLEDVNNTLYNEVKYDDQDQCWFTYVLSKHIDSLNICFSNIQLLASSYMDVCYHGNPNPVYPNHEIIKRESKLMNINKICKQKLFGKQRIIKFFK